LRLSFTLFISASFALLASCSPEDNSGVEGVDGVSGYAVVSSDYTSTSIALLNADGTILDADFINSGSAPVGLVTVLSGDVVVPTRSGDPEVLTIVDRFKTDVVTRVDPTSGEILGQVKTHSPNSETVGETAYSSNPHDYVYFNESEAWVTRFGPNVNADEDDLDKGNDLLLINPTTFTREARISLSSLNTEGQGTNSATGETFTETVYARPSKMVRLGDLLVVGLGRMSQTFFSLGEGMVALVDPEARTAEGFELPGLKSCQTVTPVPDDATRVLVGCTGSFLAGDDERDTAGLVLLSLRDGELVVEASWIGAEHPEAPLAVRNPVSLGGTQVFAYREGVGEPEDSADITVDRGFIIDLADGSQTELFRSNGSGDNARYVIGSGSYDPETGLLLIPDASLDSDRRMTAGLRTFTRQDDGSFEAGDILKVNDLLQVRMVRPM